MDGFIKLAMLVILFFLCLFLVRFFGALKTEEEIDALTTTALAHRQMHQEASLSDEK
jgi:hypothetical protein